MNQEVKAQFMTLRPSSCCFCHVIFLDRNTDVLYFPLTPKQKFAKCKFGVTACIFDLLLLNVLILFQ